MYVLSKHLLFEEGCSLVVGGGVEVSTRCKLGNITFTEIIRVKCEDVPSELAHCRHLLRRASSHENRKINEKHRHLLRFDVIDNYNYLIVTRNSGYSYYCKLNILRINVPCIRSL